MTGPQQHRRWRIKPDPLDAGQTRRISHSLRHSHINPGVPAPERRRIRARGTQSRADYWRENGQ